MYYIVSWVDDWCSDIVEEDMDYAHCLKFGWSGFGHRYYIEADSSEKAIEIFLNAYYDTGTYVDFIEKTDLPISKEGWVDSKLQSCVALRPNDTFFQGEGKVFLFDLRETLNCYTKNGVDFSKDDMEGFHPYIVQDENVNAAADRFMDWLFEREEKKDIDEFIKKEFIINTHWNSLNLDEFENREQLFRIQIELNREMFIINGETWGRDKEYLVKRYMASKAVTEFLHALSETGKRLMWRELKQYDIILKESITF